MGKADDIRAKLVKGDKKVIQGREGYKAHVERMMNLIADANVSNTVLDETTKEEIRASLEATRKREQEGHALIEEGTTEALAYLVEVASKLPH